MHPSRLSSFGRISTLILSMPIPARQAVAMKIDALIATASVLAFLGLVWFLISRSIAGRGQSPRTDYHAPSPESDPENMYTVTTQDGRPSLTGVWHEPSDRW